MNHTHNHHHHGSKELPFQQKLTTLFQHWIDHNISHKESYLSWAEKAKNEDLSDIVKCLEEAGVLTDEINSKLEKALKALS